jgi:hypothetical protein
MKTALFLALSAALAACPARAEEAAVISKARAYLGTEAALNAVQTLHFSGRVVQTLSVPGGADAQASARIEIYFEKPWRERIEARARGQLIESVLDGYDGWQRTTETGPGAAAPRFVILGADVTENLRADTWENLYFYRGVEAAGGRPEALGAATVDGVACEKVAFAHPPRIVYVRYFDKATGRLVATQTAAGVLIRESGEIMAGGIRFPKAIETRQADSAGRIQTSVYSFDSIKVNEALPDSLFSVPLRSALRP